MPDTKHHPWTELASIFHIAPANTVLAMRRMERYQSVRKDVRWMTGNEPPLALLFVSHRWETLAHPDPAGRQLAALQQFLRRVVASVEAMWLPRDERLRLVPSLDAEGDLQAHEVARRMLGFGPFSDVTAALDGGESRRLVSEQLRSARGNTGAFQAWLARRIGVWLDYTCMPQRPLSTEELPEFRRTLESLDALVASSTLIALRQPDDDYPRRGWCASEFFLGSERSFERGLFTDTDRLVERQPVDLPQAPSSASPTSASVMREAYDADLEAFRDACQAWSSFDGRMIDIHPPAAWAAYRALQGSGFRTSDQDPNPFRRALDVVRDLETFLVGSWLMSDRPLTVDLGETLGERLQRAGLRCSESSDLAYLGYVLAGRGWVDWFQPLFRDGLQRHLAKAGGGPIDPSEKGFPALKVRLEPLEEDVRALFSRVRPASPGTWHSRLATRSGLTREEKEVVEKLRNALARRPLVFAFEP